MRSRFVLLSTLLFFIGACSPVELTEVSNQVIAFGNRILVVYGIIGLMVVIFIAAGLLYWQRKNPLVQPFLNPLGNVFSRMNGGLSISDPGLVQEETKQLQQAQNLLKEINRTLNENSRISKEKKGKIRDHSKAVVGKMKQHVEQLATIRKLGQSMNKEAQKELAEMDFAIQIQLDQSLETLARTPVSILKVEVAGGDRTAERLIEQLDEANSSMRDLADSYQAIRRLSSG